MLRAFLDASTAGNPPILAVAGFVAHLDGWSAFQREWRKARARAGIEYFHTTEFMSPNGRPYNAWSPKKRASVFNRLVGLINECVEFGVAVSLNVADYRRLLETGHALPNKPYRLCVGQCVALVAKQLTDFNVNERVMYVFDAGDDGAKAFKTTMAMVIAASEKFREVAKIHSFMPGRKRHVPAIDAADLLAWHFSHHVPGATPETTPPPSLMGRVTKPVFHRYWGAVGLEKWGIGNTPEQQRAIAAMFGVRLRAKIGKQRKRRGPSASA
jgi:hypothetical protein